MAHPMIAYCCDGNICLQRYFQLWQWRAWMTLMHLTGMSNKHLGALTRYISQNVPGAIHPGKAAQQLKERMNILQGE